MAVGGGKRIPFAVRLVVVRIAVMRIAVMRIAVVLIAGANGGAFSNYRTVHPCSPCTLDASTTQLVRADSAIVSVRPMRVCAGTAFALGGACASSLPEPRKKLSRRGLLQSTSAVTASTQRACSITLATIASASCPTCTLCTSCCPTRCTPNSRVRAAKAGKHVLCEKPMATSVADGQRMIAACAEAKKALMIAYRMQYEPYNRELIWLARSGALGKLKGLLASNGQAQGDPKQWRVKKALAGGRRPARCRHLLPECRSFTFRPKTSSPLELDHLAEVRDSRASPPHSRRRRPAGPCASSPLCIRAAQSRSAVALPQVPGVDPFCGPVDG